MIHCGRCGGNFKGKTLLCPSCQLEVLKEIARNDPEGTTDSEALAALKANLEEK